MAAIRYVLFFSLLMRAASGDEVDPRAEMHRAAIDQAETTPPPLPPDVFAQHDDGRTANLTASRGSANGPAVRGQRAVHAAAHEAALDAARIAINPALAVKLAPGGSATATLRGQGASQSSAAETAHGQAVRESGKYGKPPEGSTHGGPHGR